MHHAKTWHKQGGDEVRHVLNLITYLEVCGHLEVASAFFLFGISCVGTRAV